jgi:hypothetical protein
MQVHDDAGGTVETGFPAALVAPVTSGALSSPAFNRHLANAP